MFYNITTLGSNFDQINMYTYIVYIYVIINVK
jgi:hypothetical protein